MPELVSVRSLYKDYGKGTGIQHALAGVDFQAGTGQVTVLLGRNGAGKSTLLKCVAGMIIPTAGEVTVCGEGNPDRIRASVGYVGESPFLDGDLTVAESLYLELEQSCEGKGRAFWMETGQKAIEFAGIGAFLKKKCGDLSKGYAQRVALALAICRDPAVFVMDEFSSGLDPAQAVAIRRAVKELSKTKAVVVSTHSISEAEALDGFIYVMAGGRISGHGRGKDLQCMTGKRTLEDAFLALSLMEN